MKIATDLFHLRGLPEGRRAAVPAAQVRRMFHPALASSRWLELEVKGRPVGRLAASSEGKERKRSAAKSGGWREP